MPSLPDVLRQYGVAFAPAGADRHVRTGWVGRQCPYCTGSPGLHLGYNLEKGFFHCWRCGFHPSVDVIQKLCHVDLPTALEIYRSADGPVPGRSKAKDQRVQKAIGSRRYKRPSGVGPMLGNHRRYLAGRGFDPDEVEAEWGVEGTGPISRLDDLDYRFRLFVPIYWDGVESTFQARDVTGKSEVKYKACPTDRELVHHKHVVYRHPRYEGSLGIAVEGVTDAWRLGPMAFAVFGIEYRIEQLDAIAGLYGSVAVLFDAEPTAMAQARKLAGQLSNRGVRATVFRLEDDADPGSMSRDDARRAVDAVLEWDATC